MGKLQVTICGARNLHDSQVVSLPDPYCRIRLGDKTYKTKVIDNDLNPEWDETFRFQVADENSAQICVELWNKNVISDDVMGTYIISLSGMTKGVVRDDWYLLSHSKTNAELHLRMLACDFGVEPKIADRWKITGDISKDPALDAAQLAAAGGAPHTVSSNNNNAPSAPHMGPAVVPPQAQYPPQGQPMYQQQMRPPPQGYYPPQQQMAPPQGYYPPQQPMAPQQGYYPPQQPMAPLQGYYPPQQGYYPPQQGQYPPQRGQYPPQQGQYPPQQQPYYGSQQGRSPADPNYRY